jgi:hypothetical protein
MYRVQKRDGSIADFTISKISDAIKQAFDTMGITLLEHVLVAGERYAPLLCRSEKLVTTAPDAAAFYADAVLSFEEVDE